MKYSLAQAAFLKVIFVFAGILFLWNNSEAKKVSGYIITEKTDTIYGTIKLYRYNANTGGFTINGIDMEWFHLQVTFSPDSAKKFKTYYPKMIDGFGFNYKSVNYHFHSFNIVSKSISLNNAVKSRFLNSIYEGKVSLYKDIVRMQEAGFYLQNASDSNSNINHVFYEYYLFSDLKGLLKVEMTDEIKTIIDLLRVFNIEEQFIKTLPSDITFKDIEKILYLYDNWLKESASEKIDV